MFWHLQPLDFSRLAAQHRRRLAGQGVGEDSLAGAESEVSEGDEATAANLRPFPRAAEGVETFVGEMEQLLRLGVSESHGVEHLVRGHHHQRTRNGLSGNVSVDDHVFLVAPTRQLGIKISADLPRRFADCRQAPPVGCAEGVRQQRGLNRGSDLQLPFELRLAGALVKQDARFERDRGLVEETPHELQLLLLEGGLACFPGEQDNANRAARRRQQACQLHPRSTELGAERLYFGRQQAQRSELVEPHERALALELIVENADDRQLLGQRCGTGLAKEPST